jgi:hypothetical protein
MWAVTRHRRQFKETMADLMVRPNGGSRGLVSDLFGFDPLRAVFGSTPYGEGGDSIPEAIERQPWQT